ncbi:hypothetical protein M8494_25250 [Serratia ureilytica]
MMSGFVGGAGMMMLSSGRRAGALLAMADLPCRQLLLGDWPLPDNTDLPPERADSRPASLLRTCASAAARRGC